MADKDKTAGKVPFCAIVGLHQNTYLSKLENISRVSARLCQTTRSSSRYIYILLRSCKSFPSPHIEINIVH